MGMRLTFLGTGDAFGAGGRFQTCFLLESGESRVLIDCGATSLAALKAEGIDPDTIDAVLLTHLHGDHFGGVPLLILEAVVASGRSRPLTIAGPPETEERIKRLGDALYPAMWRHEPGFELIFLEMEHLTTHRVTGLDITPHPVEHSEAANSSGLRIEGEGKILAYTGDSGWTETLIPLAQGADLLVAECYYFLPRGAGHMDYRTLTAHLDELGASRVVLTHMSEEMLARADGLSLECARDGKVIEL